MTAGPTLDAGAPEFDFPLLRPSRLRNRQPEEPSRRRSGHAGTETPQRRGSGVYTGGAIALTVLAMTVFGVGTLAEGVEGGGALVAAPVLMCIVILISHRFADELVPALPGLVQVSFGVKLVVAYLRFRSGADSVIYNEVGRDLARSFRNLDFAVDTDRTIPGTGTVRYLTGLVHVITNSSFSATFLVFAFFGFWGQYFFFRALRVGIPGAAVRRYAGLVLFWPSLMFWPASIGKESITLLGLGLVAYGLARFVSHSAGAFLTYGIGLVVITMVRPHVALVVVLATSAPLVLRRSRAARPWVPIVAVALLLLAAVVTVKQTEKRLELDELNSTSLVEQLDRTVNQTAQGGGRFRAAQVRTPIDIPWAVVTVAFRPFPFEARGGEALVASAEGMALAALLAWQAGPIAAALRRFWRHPMLVFVLLYSLVFVFLFSSIANFGILARQRTQLTPFLLMIAALPSARLLDRKAARP